MPKKNFNGKPRRTSLGELFGGRTARGVDWASLAITPSTRRKPRPPVILEDNWLASPPPRSTSSYTGKRCRFGHAIKFSQTDADCTVCREQRSGFNSFR